MRLPALATDLAHHDVAAIAPRDGRSVPTLAAKAATGTILSFSALVLIRLRPNGSNLSQPAEMSPE